MKGKILEITLDKSTGDMHMEVEDSNLLSASLLSAMKNEAFAKHNTEALLMFFAFAPDPQEILNQFIEEVMKRHKLINRSNKSNKVN